MNSLELHAKNIKCGGCAANIKNGLSDLTGVEQVEVDIETGRVIIEGNGFMRDHIETKLAELGYPVA